ncbi:MAG: lysostaphin resistance A-like protein, partial [Pseudomonadota bacterium]
YTLAAGIGFWPTAAILSALFGAVHLGNKGEGWAGALGAATIGLFFCLTLRRTGNLWFAVGMHASFNWGQTFLFSVPNSGMTPQGHLSNAELHGPRWLTGGTVGPEGSVFCFLTMALLFVLFLRFYPAGKPRPQS